MGDFLLVGVHTDDAVASLKGPTMPIQQMHERVLRLVNDVYLHWAFAAFRHRWMDRSVLSCRAVDEVVVGAPVHISEAMLSQMRIDIVAHGTTSDYMDFETGNNARGDNDPFRIPKEKGIFRMVLGKIATFSYLFHRLTRKWLIVYSVPESVPFFDNQRDCEPHHPEPPPI